jgi:hypothetical protein
MSGNTITASEKNKFPSLTQINNTVHNCIVLPHYKIRTREDMETKLAGENILSTAHMYNRQAGKETW